MTSITDRPGQPAVAAPAAASAPRSAADLVSAEVEPIIPGFHPDPSICRAGDDYYLVTSSFEYSPGVPVWHSADLTSWTLVGNAFSEAQDWVPGHARSSGGVYAPTIRHHDGRFWIITTDVTAATGQVVTSATDPAGPWSPLRRIEGLLGIDPDLVWDGDDCYVTYCSTDPELVGIAQARIDLDTGRVLEGPAVIWGGTGLAFPEAPHLYRHDGWWHLVIAEGGTERGHAVTAARSRSPRGPFVSAPANPILSHRSTTHPVQNTGHADLVETAHGEWAAVYLAVRPRGTTPMFHVNGRETFLAGVRWDDGWPVIDTGRYDIPRVNRSFVDAFDAADGAVHPRWVSPGLSIHRQLQPAPGGGAHVRHVDAPSLALTAVTTRVTDPHWRFSVDIGPRGGADATGEDIAGVLVRIDDDHWAEIRVGATDARAIARIGPLEQQLGAPVALSPAAAVVVTIAAVAPTTGGPDDLRFTVGEDGSETEIGRLDGRYLSTEVAGGFTGRVVGFRAVTGSFHLARARYAAVAEASAPEV